MKRSKITFFLTIVLGITLHSCLDMEPQDQLGGKNMWTSVNDYKQFANTFYSWTRDFSSVVYDGTHSDKRSDLITYQSYNEFSRGINSIPSSDANYTDNYKHIRRTNLLIENAETYSKPEDIKQYLGGPALMISVLTIVFNLILTGIFVVWVEKLTRSAYELEQAGK